MNNKISLKKMYDEYIDIYRYIIGDEEDKKVKYYDRSSVDWDEVLESLGFLNTDNIVAVITSKGQTPIAVQLSDGDGDVMQKILPAKGSIISFSDVIFRMYDDIAFFGVTVRSYKNIAFFDVFAFYLFRGDLSVSADQRAFFNYEETILVKYVGGGDVYNIPKGIVKIEDSAFKELINLSCVIIPNSVVSIGASAFSDCWNLELLTVPDSVTAIADEAFYGCRSLKKLVVPDSVTELGNGAFMGCVGLESVRLSSNIKNIAPFMFLGCESLKEVNIPSGVNEIEKRAFAACYSLETVTIPGSVVEIGEGVFNENDKLSAILVSEDNPVFKSIDGNLYSKDGSILIQYAVGKEDTMFNIPDGVKVIGNHAFVGSKKLCVVRMPDSVVEIGESAFSCCENMSAIDFSNSSLREISQYAFEACSSLYGIILPGSVKKIGAGAFCKCRNLLEVIVPESLDSIGAEAFKECNSLEYFKIPDGVTKLEKNTFLSCSNLGHVIIPKTVKSIDESVFRYCSSLCSVFYEGTMEEWNEISIDEYAGIDVWETKVYFYSKNKPPLDENKVDYDGNYWRYGRKKGEYKNIMLNAIIGDAMIEIWKK